MKKQLIFSLLLGFLGTLCAQTKQPIPPLEIIQKRQSEQNASFRGGSPVWLLDTVVSKIPTFSPDPNLVYYNYDSYGRVVKESNVAKNASYIGNGRRDFSYIGTSNLLDTVKIQDYSKVNQWFLSHIQGHRWENKNKYHTYTEDLVDANTKLLTKDLQRKEVLDTLNRTIESIDELWNKTSAKYYPDYKSTRKYNGNNLVYRTSANWSNGSKKWVPSDSTYNDYLNNLLQEEQTYFWYTNVSGFKPNYKYSYTYDAQGRDTITTAYEWNLSTKVWVPTTRSVYSYVTFPDSIVTTIKGEELQNNVWKSFSRQVDTKHPTEGFNLHHQLFAADSTNTLSVDTRYFWSQHKTISAVPTVVEVKCTFANPYSQGNRIQCDALANVALVLATDMTGRVVFQKALNQETSFEINQALPNGLYVLAFFSKEKTLLAKKKLMISE
jgi:hypothetical protein